MEVCIPAQKKFIRCHVIGFYTHFKDHAETPKKPKMKPKVQENIDVKQMAYTNQV